MYALTMCDYHKNVKHSTNMMWKIFSIPCRFWIKDLFKFLLENENANEKCKFCSNFVLKGFFFIMKHVKNLICRIEN